MDIFMTYAENLGQQYPRTASSAAAQRELATHMQSEYRRLLSEGHGQNDALAIVMAAAGEAAGSRRSVADMPLPSTPAPASSNGDVDPEEAPTVSEASGYDIGLRRAERYLLHRAEAASEASLGIALLLAAPLAYLIGEMLETAGLFTARSAGLAGSIGWLILLMAGLLILVTAGRHIDRRDHLETVLVRMHSGTRAALRRRYARQRRTRRLIAVSAVLLIVMALGLYFIAYSRRFDAPLAALALILLGSLLAISGVTLLIRTVLTVWAYRGLLLTGYYPAEQRDRDRILAAVEPVYVLVTLGLYLLTGAVSGHWFAGLSLPAVAWLIHRILQRDALRPPLAVATEHQAGHQFDDRPVSSPDA